MTNHAIELPQAIATYQSAHDVHDIDRAMATFTSDAVVEDEDQQWVGADQIRSWLRKTSSEYTYTRTLLGVEALTPDSWLVRNRLDGNFPGGTVELRYEFTLDGDLISKLTIAP
jgi:ketosteroid isomerase-like protein